MGDLELCHRGDRPPERVPLVDARHVGPAHVDVGVDPHVAPRARRHGDGDNAGPGVHRQLLVDVQRPTLGPDRDLATSRHPVLRLRVRHRPPEWPPGRVLDRELAVAVAPRRREPRGDVESTVDDRRGHQRGVAARRRLEQAGDGDLQAEALLQDKDLVLDCSDNVAARELINHFCLRLAKSWVYASVYQFSGQVAVFRPGKACYQCLFPSQTTETLDCNAAGVLGVLPGIVGTLQAKLAIDELLHPASNYDTQLLLIESDSLALQKIAVPIATNCPACSGSSTQATSPAPLQTTNPPAEISVPDFIDKANEQNSVVLDVREAHEHSAYNLADKTPNHHHIP